MGGDTSNLNQITPAKNIVSIPTESSFANIFVPIKTVCDSFLVKPNLAKSIESIESVENSFPFNMISDSAYLLALNVFISEIGKKTLNNK